MYEELFALKVEFCEFRDEIGAFSFWLALNIVIGNIFYLFLKQNRIVCLYFPAETYFYFFEIMTWPPEP